MTPDQGAAQALPTWNLADLYAGSNAPEVERDLKEAAAKAADFRQQHEGRLPGLGGAEFLAAITAYERIQEILGRLMSYAQLLYAGDMSNNEYGRFQQNINERATQISLETLFFTLEINKLPDSDMEAKLTHAPLRRFAPWLETVRAFRPHQLPDDLEKMLHERDVVGRQAWMRLFDETMADLRFEVDGRKLTSNEALNLLYEQDGAKRKAAAEAVATGPDERSQAERSKSGSSR
jgi:oligoendopeptidase F